MRARPATATVMMCAYLAFSFSALPAALHEFHVDVDREVLPFVLYAVLPAVVATWLYWRAYRFPPTFAAAIMLIAIVLINLLSDHFFLLRWEQDFGGKAHNLAGIATLIIAVSTLISASWWDMTDIRRETERSQVAFWLHCCAGFLISRSLFSLLTGRAVIDDNLVLTGLGVDQFPYVLAMIGGAALVSLLLDRRSLLVGVLLPTVGMFETIDSGFVGVGIGMLLAGVSLLFFSWGWVRLRIALLGILPRKWAAQLPRTGLGLEGQRPTRRHLPLLPLRSSRKRVA
jgi:heme/copper-type cytochrome/quinol oxidase subunit 4